MPFASTDAYTRPPRQPIYLCSGYVQTPHIRPNISRVSWLGLRVYQARQRLDIDQHRGQADRLRRGCFRLLWDIDSRGRGHGGGGRTSGRCQRRRVRLGLRVQGCQLADSNTTQPNHSTVCLLYARTGRHRLDVPHPSPDGYPSLDQVC